MIERMPGEAQESSGAWNNAGTGHAANCELNYTPMRKDGSVDIAKALEVNVEFDLSRQFWSYLISKGAIASPDSFIHPVPHMSFVIGEDRAAFLKKRHAAMSAHHCYHGMEFSRGPQADRRMGAAGHGGPRSQPGRRRHPHRQRRRRELRRAHPQPDRLPEEAGSASPCISRTTSPTCSAGRPATAGGSTCSDEQTGETRRIGARYVFLGAGGGAISAAAEVAASPRPRASPASR